MAKKSMKPVSPYQDSEGNYVPRVSSIIAESIPTPEALIQWQLWLACEHGENQSGIKAITNRAAAIGTVVHDMIEETMLAARDVRKPSFKHHEDPGVRSQAMLAYRYWLQWVDEVQDLEPYEFEDGSCGVEKRLISEKYKYGGTADFVGSLGMFGDKVFIGDWKTSKTIGKDQQRLQLGAYATVLKEVHGLTVDGGFIMRAEKRHHQVYNTYEMIMITQDELRVWAKAFLKLRQNYDCLFEARLLAEASKIPWDLNPRFTNVEPFLTKNEEAA